MECKPGWDHRPQGRCPILGGRLAGMGEQPVFDIPEAVLDALDDLAGVEFEEDWREHPSDELMAMTAGLDEALAGIADEQGVKANLDETMSKLIIELHRRRDMARYSAARVAHEVMEAGIRRVAQQSAPLN